MASPSSPCGFLSLPRELRDDIYDQLLQPNCKARMLKLLQKHLEYGARCSRKSKDEPHIPEDPEKAQRIQDPPPPDYRGCTAITSVCKAVYEETKDTMRKIPQVFVYSDYARGPYFYRISDCIYLRAVVDLKSKVITIPTKHVQSVCHPIIVIPLPCSYFHP
ncbi:MAG: hypothetical protein Q9227_003065 [Pyrenula ochraceoflavens]